jgi:hypothetical protein
MNLQQKVKKLRLRKGSLVSVVAYQEHYEYNIKIEKIESEGIFAMKYKSLLKDYPANNKIWDGGYFNEISSIKRITKL